MYQHSETTDWAISQKGNQWRRINGKVLVVGKRKDGKFWAMFDGEFLKGSFATELLAKCAATDKANGDDDVAFWKTV
jgi:lipocalin